MRGLRKPPYSSSKAWGRSQWKRVTNGCIPTNVVKGPLITEECGIKKSVKV